jgi:hypothetical protein
VVPRVGEKGKGPAKFPWNQPKIAD